MSNSRTLDRLQRSLEAARADRDPAPTCVASPSDHCDRDVLDPDRLQRVVAELGSDWAFVIRIDADGGWEREWFAGTIPTAHEALRMGIRDAAWNAFIHPDDLDLAVAHFGRALETGSDRCEYRLQLPEHETLWVEASLRRESGRDGVVRVYGSMRDITQRQATEQALRESEGQYRTLVEQATDGIVVFDERGQILTSNRAAHELFGFSRAALHATKVIDLFHPEDLDRDPLAIKNLAAGITLRSVRRLKRQGQNGWVWAELSATRLQDGRVQATARDITARMEAEQRIRKLAYFDSLTELPNRELFREQTEQALDRARRTDKQFAILFLDVDRFKQVNDSLGHSVGDRLLCQISDRLRAAVRGSDSVGRGSTAESDRAGGSGGPISRLGGDEFTILLEDLEHAQDAARVARRVLHAMSRSFMVEGREIYAGASVGIAVWPEDGSSSEDLLRSADVAMYHAKNRGGNVYEFFNTSMNEASSRRLEIETRLRRALERDEFQLVYQPIRDTRTSRVSAVEALVRWVDQDGNRVGPDEFIPIAEETGLIVEIGAWVLRTACQQAGAWQRAGYEKIRMSVNVSVEQLRDLGIASLVDQTIFENDLSAADLELEITESSILDENPNIVAAISELSESGIAFALDDFGTGYSSLSALQRFPIERLKIDRSFISGVGENRSDESLTSAVVALANRLELLVVAEGVETEAQAAFLSGLGCHELQGYLFSRPLPPEEVETFLRRADKHAQQADSIAGPEGAR